MGVAVLIFVMLVFAAGAATFIHWGRGFHGWVQDLLVLGAILAAVFLVLGMLGLVRI